MFLDGKVAIVTGAAQGLGKAFAKALLKSEVKVCITDVNSEQGHITLKEFQSQFGENNIMFMESDVTSQPQMEETFQMVKDTFGRIDIVCNNAGISGEVYPLWEKVVDVNVKGMICGTMLGIEHMRQDKGGNGGVIVNISSVAGLNPNPHGPVYCATKHAVVGFTRSWALNSDCISNGIRVNVLCPSFADTVLVSGLAEENCLGVTAAKEFVKKCGVMTTDFVAEGFMDLVQDESKNGAILKMSKTQGKLYHEVSWLTVGGRAEVTGERTHQDEQIPGKPPHIHQSGIEPISVPQEQGPQLRELNQECFKEKYRRK